MNDLELDVKLLRYVAITEREHKEVFSKALHRVIDFKASPPDDARGARMFSKRGWSPPALLGAPDC